MCGTAKMEIGRDVRRTLVMIPAQVMIRENIYFTYACPKCKEEGTETPIRKAERLPALIPGSYASAEAVAHIMVQKFVMYASSNFRRRYAQQPTTRMFLGNRRW
ncbi:Transposase and inactivated derivatives [uncultured Blautia sp.]|nr:Transposase and inactivated derivatives [uncultured Blautia sp.]